jgi:hypothetical protein
VTLFIFFFFFFIAVVAPINKNFEKIKKLSESL